VVRPVVALIFAGALITKEAVSTNGKDAAQPAESNAPNKIVDKRININSPSKRNQRDNSWKRFTSQSFACYKYSIIF
jgi:hypothetical protein